MSHPLDQQINAALASQNVSDTTTRSGTGPRGNVFSHEELNTDDEVDFRLSNSSSGRRGTTNEYGGGGHRRISKSAADSGEPTGVISWISSAFGGSGDDEEYDTTGGDATGMEAAVAMGRGVTGLSMERDNNGYTDDASTRNSIMYLMDEVIFDPSTMNSTQMSGGDGTAAPVRVDVEECEADQWYTRAKLRTVQGKYDAALYCYKRYITEMRAEGRADEMTRSTYMDLAHFCMLAGRHDLAKYVVSNIFMMVARDDSIHVDTLELMRRCLKMLYYIATRKGNDGVPVEQEEEEGKREAEKLRERIAHIDRAIFFFGGRYLSSTYDATENDAANV